MRMKPHFSPWSPSGRGPLLTASAAPASKVVWVACVARELSRQLLFHYYTGGRTSCNLQRGERGQRHEPARPMDHLQ